MPEDFLLENKIHPPALRPAIVSRTRLLRTLSAGLDAGRRLTLLSAPAGFGKTTLLAEWISSPALNRPAAWLTLEESESDPALFLRYLAEALHRALPEAGRGLLRLLQSPQPAPRQALTVSLLGDLADSPPFLLVLDDYHHLLGEGVHSIVESLLDHGPESMQLVIGTREDPPLPLARLRASGQITEVRQADLRFQPEETDEFLSRCMGLALPAGSVRRLNACTEGWAAGLQLAAFALQKETGPAEDFIAAFAGDHRFVMDYLVAEVLGRLPPETRDFLQQTSILDRMCAPLCDAVAGRGGSQAVLEALDAANIFLLPLDGRREWFRYHNLFAGFLRARLAPAEEATLHERAAAWFEGAGMGGQAVSHALAAAALTGRWDSAARLVQAAAGEEIRMGRVQTLLGWLSALPEETVLAAGDLAAYKGWVHALSGNFDAAERYAAAAAALPEPGLAYLLQAFIALLHRNDVAETARLAAKAIEAFRERPSEWLPMAYWLVAECSEREGKIGEAVRTLREGKQAMPPALSRVFSMLVDMMLIYDLNLCGRRREALAVGEESLRLLEETEAADSPAVGMLLGRLALLHYEAGEMEKALAAYERLSAAHPDSARDLYGSFARSLTSPLLFAAGRAEEALESLAQAVELSRQTGLADLGSLLAMQAGLRLRMGELAFAGRWAAEAGCSPGEEIRYLRLDSLLVYARWLAAAGRDEEADRLLGRLRAFLAENGMRRPLITVAVLQALLADKTGQPAKAAAYLAEALAEAAPEEYERAFLDEDPRVVDLVRAARRELGEGPARAFAERILAAVSPAAAAAGAEAEALSAREREILGLIAEGLSNADIAARLVIAPATVKRHINNIFGKLGVKSRTQALAKAKQRGWMG